MVLGLFVVLQCVSEEVVRIQQFQPATALGETHVAALQGAKSEESVIGEHSIDKRIM